MTPAHLTIAAPRASASSRAARLLAALAARCSPAATRRSETSPPAIPTDYRAAPSDRDPGGRAARSSCSSAPSRGGLDADAARRRARLRAATGGARRPAAIVIDRAVRHARTSAPPATRCSEVHSILAPAGVPPQAIERAALSAGRSEQARDAPAQLSARSPPRPARAGCGRDDLGPTYDREHFENREYWNLGCATQRNLAAMVDEPGRSGAAARRDAALHRPPHHRARQVPQGREHRRRPIRMPTRARSATSANDQNRHANRRA